MPAQWRKWDDTGWRSHEPTAALSRLLDRLAALVTDVAGSADLLGSLLPEVVMELGAARVAVVRKTPTWEVVGQSGRQDRLREPLPVAWLEQLVDREAALHCDDPPAPLLLAPIPASSPTALLATGDRLDARQLDTVFALARALGAALRVAEERFQARRRIDQLRSTLEIAQLFARERETILLLETMAEEATRRLNCDRASIFIWDRDARQVFACPALGMEGGRLWLPDNKGIVGEVIQSGKSLVVDDAYRDPRFDQSVDKQFGYVTRNLLCVPMPGPDGRALGAFEVINKHQGDFTADDRTSLEELCIPASIAIQHARERDQLQRSNRQLAEQVAGQSTIVGESPATTALRGTIERLAATDLPVLILGESGTGKEVAAQALHYQGPRASQPFIAVNCAALTETLLESELFGHEKGAFTDAHATRAGKFELADGGTLFLDEIGDLSPGGQAKLLRVLEQKVITRVGGTQVIPTNVRVIAATNSNLAEAVRAKRFRQDLYYRISVVTVDMPPLRDRPEDVWPLARHFLDLFCRQAKRPPLQVSAEARRRLQAHAWPGNVRELRNLMERVAFLVTGTVVDVGDLAFILAPASPEYDELGEGVGLSGATDRFQQEYITRAIQRVRGNMSDAAKLLGLHRSNLYRKMRQLGMAVDETRPNMHD
jgi:transcriptional regulator with GAF, ATPase, and Fis domain